MKRSVNGASISTSGIPALTHHRLTDAGGSTSEVVTVRSLSAIASPEVRRVRRRSSGGSFSLTVAAASAATSGMGRILPVGLPVVYRPRTLKPTSILATAPPHWACPKATNRRYRGVRCAIGDPSWTTVPRSGGKTRACLASQYNDSPIHSGTPPNLRSRTEPTPRMKFFVGSASGQAGTDNRALGSPTK